MSEFALSREDVWSHRLAGLLLAGVLFALLGWPALATIRAAFLGTTEESQSGLMTPPSAGFGSADLARQGRLAGETIRLVLATEAIALPIGTALGFLTMRTDAWGRRLMLSLFAIAVFVPMPLHATAWLGAFGNAGRARLFGMSPWIVGWQGAAFVHAIAAVPWIVFIVGVGLRMVEPELEESAQLDMPAWLVAIRVTLRRAIGSIAAAALAVAVLTASDMTVTDLLQVRTYAEEAYFQQQLGKGPAAAGIVTFPPLFVLGGLIVLGARVLNRSDPIRLASALQGAKLWRIGAWRVSIGAATAFVIVGTSALPIWSLVWHAGRVGGNARTGVAPHWSISGFLGTLKLAFLDAYEPMIASLTLAACAATLAVVVAWSLAWASRESNLWRLVATFVTALALAIPGPVAGIALVLAYAPFRIYNSSALVVMAEALRTFPYALLILWPAIRTLPREYLETAMIDGLGPAGIVWRIAIPSTRLAILATWGVTFVLSLGELPATNLVYPAGLMPLSVLIWTMLHSGVESRLAGIVLIMLAAVGTAGPVSMFALQRVAKQQR